MGDRSCKPSAVWSVKNVQERHLQPLLIAAHDPVANLLRHFGTFCSIVRVEGVILKPIMTRRSYWKRKLQRTAQRLIERIPFSVRRPASMIRVAFALIIDTVFCPCLANPLVSKHIPSQHQRCEQGKATHLKELESIAHNLALALFLYGPASSTVQAAVQRG